MQYVEAERAAKACSDRAREGRDHTRPTRTWWPVCWPRWVAGRDVAGQRAVDSRVVTEDYPPYNFGKRGRGGVSTAVVRAVLAEAGLDAQIQGDAVGACL